MQEVIDFAQANNLPADLIEEIEIIVCDAKEKVIKLLTERGVLGAIK